MRLFSRFRRPAPTPAPAGMPAADPFHGEARGLEASVPPSVSLEERIAMATRCRDADGVPKVPGAGGVTTDAQGRRIQLMHNGLRVVADGYYGAWMTTLIERCQGHHEPQEETIFHALMRALPPGGTMVEIGGFWAFYSLWFHQAAPGRRILLVEPDPAHIAIGQANAALNGAEAEFVPGFIGDVPGTVQPFPTEESGVLDLPCIDVPALLAERGIERLTLLHCDAQGAEFALLEQMAPVLRAGKVDWIIMSTHHHSISGDPLTHQRCLAKLRELGATIEAEHDVQESFSGDGLICARFCAPPPGWQAPVLSYNRASTSLFRHPLLDLAQAVPPRLPALGSR